jgi:hypothetical protein
MASRGVESRLMYDTIFWTKIPLVYCDTFVDLHGYGTEILNFGWMTLRKESLQLRE